jgi:hypothetical protein
MIRDALVNTFVIEVRQQIREELESLAAVSFAELYAVGKVQGRVEGLRLALSILEAVADKQDN